MKLPRPSVVRRLTLGFVLGHVLAMVLALCAIYPLAVIEDDEPVGPDLIHLALARDLVTDARGRLAVRGGGDLDKLLADHPGAWFSATVGSRKLDYGPVPSAAPTCARRA